MSNLSLEYYIIIIQELIELQNFIDNNFINNDNIVIGGDFNNNYFIYYEKKKII